MSTEESKSDWQPSGVQNLIRYAPSGVYYARFKVGGKLIRQSLKTPVKSVAKLRLADVLKDKRKSGGDCKDVLKPFAFTSVKAGGQTFPLVDDW